MGSKAKEICHHVDQAWATGQRSIELLRVELGDEADNLVPLEGGDVALHKIRGVMHDNCATANLAASLMKEKRNTSGQLMKDTMSGKPWRLITNLGSISYVGTM